MPKVLEKPLNKNKIPIINKTNTTIKSINFIIYIKNEKLQSKMKKRELLI